MIQYKKLMMTLALLLTAATGAWATDGVLLTTIESKDYTSFTSGSMTFDDKVTVTFSRSVENDGNTDGWYTGTLSLLTVAGTNGYTITSCKFYTKEGSAANGYTVGGESPSVYLYNGKVYNDASQSAKLGSTGVTKIEVYGIDPNAVEVTPGSSANTWTFTQPASDVVLTPIYSAATVYGTDGQTEKMAYETLNEAFANVQDGDVIKLDWNVTLTETLKTPSTASDISFTLDFNGFVIDNTGGTNYIVIDNGCELTLTDNSTAQTGGLKCQYPIAGSNGGKVIFQGGRYSFSGSTAEQIASGWDEMASNYGWVMGDGKEFVDIENAPDANGFTVRVGFKTFELTIGPKKFATFYADKNITFAEQPAEGVGLYTISGIDTDHSTATVTPISGIIPAGTPMLVYNGTEQEQTAKLIVTLDNAQDAIAWAPQFKGTATDREFTADDMAAADYYALSGGKAFAPVKGTGTIAAHKCWLEFAKQQIPSARQLTLVFDNDDATGVNEVSEVKEVNDNSYGKE